MTTPEPPEGERPSLQDRLAEFEADHDYDDEYDDDNAGDGVGLPVEDDVTSYDDSAFAAVGDEPSPYEPVDPHAAGHDAPSAEEPEPLAHIAEPADPGVDDESADDGATVVLERPQHDTAVLDPFAAAPAPLAAVPVDAAVDGPVEPPIDDAPAAEAPAAEAADTEQSAPAESAPAAAGRRRAKRERRERSEPRGRRLTLPVIALLIMTALMAAATAYLWLQVREERQTEAARRSGLEASRDAARLLFSYDYRTLDKDFQTGRALTTGEFRNQYEKTTTKVVADVAKQYKAVVKANVVGAGVVRATPDTIVTIVYVNQVTTSTRVAGEKVDLSRVRMTLRRSGDTWLVTSVNAL